MNQNHEKLLKRITINPKVMAGKPVIKGTRLTVQFILELLGEGSTIEEIIKEYKGLKKEDIMACLIYASEAIDHSTILPLADEVAKGIKRAKHNVR
jgi:uncharacterized protein (DUF433 family)